MDLDRLHKAQFNGCKLNCFVPWTNIRIELFQNILIRMERSGFKIV